MCNGDTTAGNTQASWQLLDQHCGIGIIFARSRTATSSSSSRRVKRTAKQSEEAVKSSDRDASTTAAAAIVIRDSSSGQGRRVSPRLAADATGSSTRRKRQSNNTSAAAASRASSKEHSRAEFGDEDALSTTVVDAATTDGVSEFSANQEAAGLAGIPLPSAAWMEQQGSSSSSAAASGKLDAPEALRIIQVHARECTKTCCWADVAGLQELAGTCQELAGNALAALTACRFDCQASAVCFFA
jgi:hypothetical protein